MSPLAAFRAALAALRLNALLEELNAGGITVILVTHELDIAARAQRRITFRDGVIVEDAA
jgi:putative ABC transport system ATP-binding protein